MNLRHLGIEPRLFVFCSFLRRPVKARRRPRRVYFSIQVPCFLISSCMASGARSSSSGQVTAPCSMCAWANMSGSASTRKRLRGASVQADSYRLPPPLHRRSAPTGDSHPILPALPHPTIVHPPILEFLKGTLFWPHRHGIITPQHCPCSNCQRDSFTAKLPYIPANLTDIE